MLGIGIDIGGTNTKLVVVNRAGKLLAQERFRTEAARGAASFVKRLSGYVSAFKRDYGRQLVSVGIGAAGDVDPARGVLRFSPNLAWRNVKLAGPLEKLTGLPCTMENDANMAAWGAYEIELKRKHDNVLAITLGTGIGSGLIIDGKLYHGADGSAGEAGHLKVQPGGRPCHCGALGCLEAYCGSYSIMARARELIKNEAAFVKKYAAPGRERFNTICLTNGAAAGHAAARKVWAETGQYLGMGLAGLILLLNPGCIVLTGGVSRAKRWFFPAMEKVLRSQQIKTPFNRVKIKVSEDADLGSHGAALFGLEKALK
ncbi:MAG: ROK family protein [Elusimicrobiales bacterium]|nr:ROK family protein [Elusimicrobiales bacterium]